MKKLLCTILLVVSILSLTSCIMIAHTDIDIPHATKTPQTMQDVVYSDGTSSSDTTSSGSLDYEKISYDSIMMECKISYGEPQVIGDDLYWLSQNTVWTYNTQTQKKDAYISAISLHKKKIDEFVVTGRYVALYCGDDLVVYDRINENHDIPIENNINALLFTNQLWYPVENNKYTIYDIESKDQIVYKDKAGILNAYEVNGNVYYTTETNLLISTTGIGKKTVYDFSSFTKKKDFRIFALCTDGNKIWFAMETKNKDTGKYSVSCLFTYSTKSDKVLKKYNVEMPVRNCGIDTSSRLHSVIDGALHLKMTGNYPDYYLDTKTSKLIIIDK